MLPDGEIKSGLQKAAALKDAGNLVDGMICISGAFQKLIEQQIFPSKGRGPRAFLFHNPILVSDDLLTGKDREYSRFQKSVKASVEELQEILTIICLAFDYKQYLKFRSLLPPIAIAKTEGGTIIRQDLGPIEISPDYYQFCYDFVVENAIRLLI